MGKEREKGSNSLVDSCVLLVLSVVPFLGYPTEGRVAVRFSVT